MQYNVHAAKAQLSKLHNGAVAGEKVIIARDPVPVIDIIAVLRRKLLVGMVQGQRGAAPDYLPPMPKDEWQLWKDGVDSPEKRQR